jgi:hypothetical protein
MNRDFKGIWIPKEIWLLEKLKPTYRVFLAEIDSLDNGNGCWAKNEHFSELFGLSKNRCSEIISMLEKEGFLVVNYRKVNGEENRFLTLKIPVEKSTGQSRNRQEQSRNRQEQSKYRQPIYKDEIYNEKYKERETRAIDFLIKNFPARYEQDFAIKYKSKIKDFEKFKMDFDDTADIEKLSYSFTLFARLSKYARNWIQNQDKFTNKLPEPIVKPNYQTNGI